MLFVVVFVSDLVYQVIVDYMLVFGNFGYGFIVFGYLVVIVVGFENFVIIEECDLMGNVVCMELIF